MQAGGLMSYGLDTSGNVRVQAEYVVRILEGQVIRNIPIWVPPFRLAINLNTAREIGIEFPPQILARADIVIDEAEPVQ